MPQNEIVKNEKKKNDQNGIFNSMQLLHLVTDLNNVKLKYFNLRNKIMLIRQSKFKCRNNGIVNINSCINFT